MPKTTSAPTGSSATPRTQGGPSETLAIDTVTPYSWNQGSKRSSAGIAAGSASHAANITLFPRAAARSHRERATIARSSTTVLQPSGRARKTPKQPQFGSFRLRSTAAADQEAYSACKAADVSAAPAMRRPEKSQTERASSAIGIANATAGTDHSGRAR